MTINKCFVYLDHDELSPTAVSPKLSGPGAPPFVRIYRSLSPHQQHTISHFIHDGEHSHTPFIRQSPRSEEK